MVAICPLRVTVMVLNAGMVSLPGEACSDTRWPQIGLSEARVLAPCERNDAPRFDSRSSSVVAVLAVGRRRPTTRPSPSSTRKRTVTIAVGFSPGGNYDLYARLVSRHLGRHIPGQSHRHRAEHAGRRQPAARQHARQCRPARRHHDRPAQPGHRHGPGARHRGREVRRPQVQLDRQPGRGQQRVLGLAHQSGEDDRGRAASASSWSARPGRARRRPTIRGS